jgi:hypothetical protein
LQITRGHRYFARAFSFCFLARDAAEHGQECIHHLGVVAFSAALDDDSLGFFRIEPTLRQGAGLQIVVIAGQRQNSCANGDVVFKQSLRKTRAVEALELGADDLGRAL